MSLLELSREEIDRIDRDMARLFEQRMRAVHDIAEYKIKKRLPIVDEGREHIVVEKNLEYISVDEIKPYYECFLRAEMEISKKYQHKILEKGGEKK